MKIYKMEWNFNFSNFDDQEIKDVFEIERIDKNWFAVGILNKTLNTSNNIEKTNVLIVNKKRLIEKKVNVENKEKIWNKAKEILNNSFEKQEFIKIIKSKKVYKISKKELEKWEFEKQFSLDDLNYIFKNQFILGKLNSLKKENVNLKLDLLEIKDMFEKVKIMYDEGFKKIMVLNSKNYETSEEKHIRKLYFNVIKENEELKDYKNISKKELEKLRKKIIILEMEKEKIQKEYDNLSLKFTLEIQNEFSSLKE